MIDEKVLLFTLYAALREYLDCPTEFDDPRVKYITIQVPRALHDDTRKLLEEISLSHKLPTE